MNATLSAPPPAKRPIRKIQAIQQTLCAHFRIDLPLLLNRDRIPKRTEIRQIGMYLARTMTSASSPEVATAFNRMDHGTVLHAEKRMSDLMDVDPELTKLVSDLMMQSNELFEVNEHARLRELGVLA